MKNGIRWNENFVIMYNICMTGLWTMPLLFQSVYSFGISLLLFVSRQSIVIFCSLVRERFFLKKRFFSISWNSTYMTVHKPHAPFLITAPTTFQPPRILPKSDNCSLRNVLLLFSTA